MIAIDPNFASSAQHNEERTSRSLRRARWMTATALLLGILLAVAGSAPIGFFVPVLVLFGFFLFSWFVPWSFAVVHAWLARRRGEARSGARLAWWLAPVPLLLAVSILTLRGTFARLATDWAADDLAALRADAAALPTREVEIPDRWLGIWPVEHIVRYASGELRMELLGARLGSRLRGIAYDPDGPPLPGSWQPERWLEMGNGWHAWERD
jgi:hypothetical protein